jgi:hypothetical protein
MSKGNQKGVSRAEYLEIKKQLQTATVAEVTAKSPRSRATINKINNSASYPKFLANNKAIQAKHSAALKAAKPAAPVAKKIVVQSAPSPLDTPRSKAHAKEVLKLRVDIETLKVERSRINDANTKLREEIRDHHVTIAELRNELRTYQEADLMRALNMNKKGRTLFAQVTRKFRGEA